ncbi:MAG: response regulator transcription factor [Eggerthellaceae bacterium]|jgi:DNA-binding response OmpR family regulator|nr:response regulator transcription factor [Eggerthellaceae bacterium]
MQILIVEDDIHLAEALARILTNAHCHTDVVHDGESGLSYAENGSYDVVVLDVMLPKMDGFQVVSTLRKHKKTVPVLMLTARDAIGDRVGGLDSGADDYMTKPFAPAELLARIRSLSRRKNDIVFDTLTYGNTTLEVSSYELSTSANSIHLGYKEFAVLKILMSNPTCVTSKETLINKVWGVDSTAADNNVEAYISFLRKKLAFIESNVHITTLRKVGYRLEIDDA